MENVACPLAGGRQTMPEGDTRRGKKWVSTKLKQKVGAKWLTQGTVNNNYLPVTYPNDYL